MAFYLRPAAIGLALMGAITAPALGSTLVYCYETSPETFMPSQAIGQSTVDATVPIYNQLVEVERGTTRIIPALAESWQTSSDGLVYTFKLRSGVKFHSNADFKPSRDLNTDDVMFTFQRQM